MQYEASIEAKVDKYYPFEEVEEDFSLSVSKIRYKASYIMVSWLVVQKAMRGKRMLVSTQVASSMEVLSHERGG